MRALGAAVGEADGAAAQIVRDTGPELIEALVRVREAASQASEPCPRGDRRRHPGQRRGACRGQPRGAGRGARPSRSSEQMAEIGDASELALATAAGGERAADPAVAHASARPRRRSRTGSTRTAPNAKRAKPRDLSRRVALIIDALNSTAIDVTKILSNEVTDSAWAAYLKGDRGVFTRRAVRLLDTGEAREILRHYEEEPEFRDQVNRYIHDFEAMLRRDPRRPRRLARSA